jgi:tetratricopeptide (TPR) repeat protein
MMFGLLKDWLSRRRAFGQMRTAQKHFSQDWHEVFKSLIDQAKAEYEVGNRERSLELWRKAYAHFPDLCASSPTALYLILDLGSFEDAEQMMQQARLVYPHHAPFAAGHALVAQRRRDFQEALHRCASLRKKFPKEAAGYAIAGECLVALDREQEAEAMFALGARRLPRDFEMNVRVARFAERRRDWAEGLKRWRVVRERFDDWRGFAGMANCLRELGRRAGAEAMLVEAIGRFPKEQWLLVEFALIPAMAGELDEAEQRWADVRRKFPYFAHGYTRGAELARQLNKEDEAEKLLELGVARCRGDVGLHVEHARAADRRGDADAALARWRLALERFPDCKEAEQRLIELTAGHDQVEGSTPAAAH